MHKLIISVLALILALIVYSFFNQSSDVIELTYQEKVDVLTPIVVDDPRPDIEVDDTFKFEGKSLQQSYTLRLETVHQVDTEDGESTTETQITEQKIVFTQDMTFTHRRYYVEPKYDIDGTADGHYQIKGNKVLLEYIEERDHSLFPETKQTLILLETGNLVYNGKSEYIAD